MSTTETKKHIKMWAPLDLHRKLVQYQGKIAHEKGQKLSLENLLIDIAEEKLKNVGIK